MFYYFLRLFIHNPPHFHARYAGEKIAINIKDLSILEGSILPRALELTIEWATLHKEELLKDWELASQNKNPDKIEPLK